MVVPKRQSPGVIGTSRQFVVDRGGAVGVAVGVGDGAGRGCVGGGTTCGTHDANSMALARSGSERIELGLERRRGFAFIRSLWNDARSISSAQG